MKCRACNVGVLHHKVKSKIFTYKGKSATLEQPGLWCGSCEEGILDAKDIAKTEKTFEAFKAKVDGSMHSYKAKLANLQFKRILSNLRLSAYILQINLQFIQ